MFEISNNIILNGPKQKNKSGNHLKNYLIEKVELFIDNSDLPINLDINRFYIYKADIDNNENGYRINYKFNSLDFIKKINSNQNISGECFLFYTNINNYSNKIIELDFNPEFLQIPRILQFTNLNYTNKVFLNKCYYADLVNLPTFNHFKFKIYLNNDGVKKFEKFLVNSSNHS